MSSQKENLRKRRHARIRAKLSGTPSAPRLSVYRSNSAIYAQLIDDQAGTVLASASSLKMKKGTGIDQAKEVGKEIAKAAKGKKVDACVFDRGGYLYHGRVKALAEGAREGGLTF
ncbi:50S ribosomal protein L18 [Candidatus Peregrinibacteria bacterium]|nr:MAG: 50S ribosomal protein L18 [Candidatus Peregrinibacteria bacterium]